MLPQTALSREPAESRHSLLTSEHHRNMADISSPTQRNTPSSRSRIPDQVPFWEHMAHLNAGALTRLVVPTQHLQVLNHDHFLNICNGMIHLFGNGLISQFLLNYGKNLLLRCPYQSCTARDMEQVFNGFVRVLLSFLLAWNGCASLWGAVWHCSTQAHRLTGICLPQVQRRQVPATLQKRSVACRP